MATITTTIQLPGTEFSLDPAEAAAIAFLARCNGRTLDAYRHDLRNLFQRAADHDLGVLDATRAHLEFYRTSMEHRGLAALTVDRLGQTDGTSQVATEGGGGTVEQAQQSGAVGDIVTESGGPMYEPPTVEGRFVAGQPAVLADIEVCE